VDGHEVDPIDSRLAARWESHGLQPAARCTDGQFLRRLSLDLLGRIPTEPELEAFLQLPDRSAAIERMLGSQEFDEFWALNWTTQLYGYAENSADSEMLQHWLVEQITAQRGYDETVRRLITANGESAFDGAVNFLLRYPDEPVVKVSRAFLGVRLDCARCHDHPFDRWTKDDFTRMNRFFAGLERRDVAAGNARLVDVVRELPPDERPRFLTGAQPRTTQWRSEFALFLTSSRPFARNFANRLWYHMLGRGIVHPVDDVSRENRPAVPELLEWLADESQRSRFDVRHMLRLIANSTAYQLDSRSQRGDEERLRLFAVRTLKPMTPEQLYTSTCVALGKPVNPDERFQFVRAFLADALDGDFGSTWEYRETVQGLMSRLVETQIPPTRDFDALFRRILSRAPSGPERAALASRPAREVGFVLLNCSEFAFNH
jgi:hypothetical protein